MVPSSVQLGLQWIRLLTSDTVFTCLEFLFWRIKHCGCLVTISVLSIVLHCLVESSSRGIISWTTTEFEKHKPVAFATSFIWTETRTHQIYLLSGDLHPLGILWWNPFYSGVRVVPSFTEYEGEYQLVLVTNIRTYVKSLVHSLRDDSRCTRPT